MSLDDMKMKIERNPQTLLTIKILLVVGAAFLLYLVANYYYLRWASYNAVNNNLKQENARIIVDLQYKNGKWDTSSYVNDSQIPQNNPLYVITNNGFIIDRESPINGFLDTSTYQYSASFSTPRTITSPVNEQWQMFSKPVMNGKTQAGIVTVGFYQPDPKAVKDIDKQLENTANSIASNVKGNGDTLDVSAVDTRNININISYEIVDRFNRTLSSVGGAPSYIDTSYLPSIIKNKFAVETDNTTNASFATVSTPMFDKNNNLIAVVITGYPLAQVNADLRNQLVFAVASGIVAIAFLLFLLGYLIRRELANLAQKVNETIVKSIPTAQKTPVLFFDKDASAINFNDKILKVPYDSNQFYVCKVLFSNSKKRWENDEIVEKVFPETDFEEVSKYWRKVYDAIRGLNEKSQQEFGFDVVIFEAKTCRINHNLPSNE